MKEQAYSTFNALKLGQSIIISEFAKRDPKAFKSYAIDYINDTGALEFSQDYNVITKCNSFDDIRSRQGIEAIINFNRQ